MAKEHHLDFQIAGFGGTNNLQDAARLKGPPSESIAECAKISNFDITDTLSASTRQGTKKIYAGTKPKLDPNGSGLFVESGYLKLLLPDFINTITLYTLKSLAPMSYTPVNYLTVCSNGVDLLIVENGVATPFSTPTANFKEAIQPAQIVSYFSRRLYYAVGPALYYSDPDNIEQADTRDDPFVFKAPITMVMPLDNGIYVSADKIYWLAGRAPEEMTISGVAYDGQAVKGTDQIFDGSFIAEHGQMGHPFMNAFGKWGAFSALDGVCLCSDNGRVINTSLKIIDLRNNKQIYGGSLIKYEAGLDGSINQYISWMYQSQI